MKMPNLLSRTSASKNLFLYLLATLVAFLLPASATAQEDAFTQALNKGPLYAGLAAFLGGLVVNLTPCVFPLIVITTSVFGAKQAKSRSHAMALSTMYVLGIVVLFTTVLVITAMVGGTFGAALANPWVTVGIAILFAVLAASMFGAFELTLPESVMQRLSGVGGVGYGGAFSLGLVSGVIAAPCTGPVLLGIMLWIAKSGNVALGAVVGICFAVGLGLPTWFVGTFAASMPKGGKWMVWVKSFFGCALLILSFKFIGNAFPEFAAFAKNETKFLAAAAGLAVFGLLIGAVHVNWDDGGLLTKARKALGIVATVAGGFIFWAAYEKPREATAEELQAAVDAAKKDGADGPVQLLEFGKDEAAGLAKAKSENRPVLIDFRADWCAACKELEKHTFSDATVKVKAGRFVGVKVDGTNDEDPAFMELKKKYGILGLPTVVLLDSQGKEKKRFTEFQDAQKFLATIEDVN